jgi:hypothetical protein
MVNGRTGYTAGMRKRRTREHVIADLSANHVARFFLQAGHTAESVYADYGYDLFIQTFDPEGFLESGCLFVQIKASDNPRRVAGGEAIAVTLTRGDLEVWTEEFNTVVVVFYDVAEETACWLDTGTDALADAVAGAVGETMTVRIPVENRVDARAIATMHQLKNARANRKRGTSA